MDEDTKEKKMREKRCVLKFRVRRLLLALMLGLLLGFCTERVLFHQKRRKSIPKPEEKAEVEKPLEVVTTIDDIPLLLKNEKRFRETLRSCLGTACLAASPTKKPRIALLAPPHPIASRVWQVLLRYVKDESLAEFLVSSHAVPYGYGRNHGLTRIIRLVLPLQFEQNALTLSQSVRWHCRLSHVAAHTSLLTIDLSDTMPPRRTIELALSFIGLKIDHSILDDAVRQWDTLVTPAFSKALDFAKRYSQPNRTIVLDSQLQSELASTNNLRKWPCATLWVSKDDQDALSRAPLMAPNCSAPFSQCTVPRDKCEFSGGAC